MQCIIIDDEPLALELLEDNIKQVPELRLSASCRNAAQARAILETNEIDLVFCDIQMPGINGLQLVKSLTKKPLVIFVTAYQEFAIDGFELDVVDYLLKPVSLERFLRACNKALKFFKLDQPPNVANDKITKHLFVYADYNLIKVNYEEIAYIEGLKDYVKIHAHGQQKPLLTRLTIKSLEEQLPRDRFFRIHKSYIVNLDHVRSIRKGQIKLANAEIPYSDNYKENLVRMTGRVS
jgi:DNA-binding LytR/AlgR family response regulator